MSFVHLHLHSEYSLLDGACRIKDIPGSVIAAGMNAVAITDHGNMYGTVAFFDECKKAGVKPIVGCEVYVAPDSRFSRSRDEDKYYHLVLLVKNETGYKNLSYLVSAGFTEGFYTRPRIDLELLSKYHEGLVCLSGCSAGFIARSILNSDMDTAREHALFMKGLFGEDYYLEIQDHNTPEEDEIRRGVKLLSDELSIETVATNDVHYLERTDAEKQLVLTCIATNSLVENGSPIGFTGNNYYFKSEEEMRSLFRDDQRACDNTQVIADKCNFEFEFGHLHLPAFPLPAGIKAKNELKKLAEQGLSERLERGQLDLDSHTQEDYKFRMIYELMIIEKMGYSDYFLIVRDFVAYAKDNKIPTGPGRGSGCGSLVAYLIRITEVDPIRYDLLFERFLNPERVSMPDFDIDFCYERRDEVIEYVKRKYGDDHVSQIAAFGTLAARAAVRDVGRALGMSYSDIDRVAKLIPHKIGVTIADAIGEGELKELYNEDVSVRKLIDISSSLEGMPRHLTTHAAGIVITEKPVCEYLPLTVSGDAILTEFEKETVERLGLLKFDFLAIRYLTVIEDAAKKIRRHTPDFDIEKVPLDDEATYALMSEGNTSGVFQLESAGMRRLLCNLAPRRIEDVMIAIALYRPGPMDSIPKFLENRGKKPQYALECLAEILDETSGCIVYQEQVMQIFRKVAGYSYGNADMIRRIMAKKKVAEMEKEREKFISGAQKMKVAPEIAQELFDDMASFASYAFNKSHAAAYAYTSYRTAYLKAHYPAEYLSSLLTSVSGSADKTAEYIADCSKMGLRVLPPDVNESGIDFEANGKNLRFCLAGIKNASEGAAALICRERSGKPFTSFVDFVDRTCGQGINKQQIYSLICAGAFDSFGIYRSRLLQSLDEIVAKVQDEHARNIDGQTDLFSMAEDTKQDIGQYNYPDIPEMPLKSMLALEKEMTGLYFSGHLLDDFSLDAERSAKDNVSAIVASFDEESESFGTYSDKGQVTICGIITRRTQKTTKNGDPMAFISLEDRTGEIEVVIFPKLYAQFMPMISEGAAICINGNISSKEDEAPKILASFIKPLVRNCDVSKEAPQDQKQKIEPQKPQMNEQERTSLPDTEEKKIYLRVPDMECEAFRRALALCEIFAGKVRIIFYDSANQKYISSSVHCDGSEFLIRELAEVLGRGCVVIK